MPEITVTLPDGSEKSLPEGSTVRDLAESIGSRLAAAALAGKVDGRLVDTTTLLAGGETVEIVTDRSPDALHILRHSAAHVMAEAVVQLFPMAKVAIGPAIEDGFYYDFDVPRPFTPEDLEAIEQRMRDIIAEEQPFQRAVLDKVEALDAFKEEPYKEELVHDLPDGEEISTYTQGQLHRSVPGPARPEHRLHQGVQAHEGGRRLLARRLEPPHAPAHIRDRLVLGQGPGRLPEPPGGGRAPRPPQAGQGTRSVQLPRDRGRGSAHLPPEGRTRAAAHAGVAARRSSTSAATSRPSRRTSTRPTCGRSAATTTSTARTCTSSRSTRETAGSTSTPSSP